jgi:hypothetical protein
MFYSLIFLAQSLHEAVLKDKILKYCKIKFDMDKYAIFSCSFFEVPIEKDWTKTEDIQPNFSDENCRMRLDKLFGDKKSIFDVRQLNKHDADKLPCTVLAHPDCFVLLRLEHPKEEKIFDKRESKNGDIDLIEERHIPSFPYIYIIIDCRQKVGCKIAFSIDSNAWRSLDKVAAVFQESVNRQLRGLSWGFGIKISPITMQIDFVSHSRRLIKKENLRVDKMTIYFSNGTINPEIEEIVKNDSFIKGLMQRMYNAPHGELTLYGPEGSKIINAKSKVFQHLVTLVGSDPVAQPFRLSMSYSDGSVYKCGKDVRMEFWMSDNTFMSLLGMGTLFPQDEIGAWFDEVTRKIEKQIG